MNAAMIPGSLEVPLVALLGVLGLAVGSFLNVVIYRVPRGLSIVAPASACPTCGGTLKSRDNIPVVSWLLLKGRCRFCRAAISVRYPIVEATTAILFLAVGWKMVAPVVHATSTPALVAAVLVVVAFSYLMAISVALAAIDIELHRLPNAIVLPALGVGGVLLAIAGLLNGDVDALVRAAVGAVLLFAFYLTLAFVQPGGMGMGDVKLAGVLGLFLGFLGWPGLIVGVAASFLLGGLFGVALILLRKVSRTSGIPFGPWMLVGAWVGVFAGSAIADGYLSSAGLI
ncbi:MAG: prepilin peptidase [Microbacteriaceae bacterium]|jgi:leader peptidase (prepilin peptidase)/N-methyltransferase|nr:prepilin peptidase [Microbacteriaceae bacterium]